MSILVVDDERAMRDMIADVLKASGYEVVAASSAEKAISIVLDGGIDMITLDYSMPGMSGAEFQKMLSQELGAVGQTSGVVQKRLPPILLVTGVPGDEEVMRAAMGEGVVGVLGKPFRPKELVEIVNETLGR